MPKHAFAVPCPFSKCCPSFSASPKTRISPSLKMGKRMPQASFGALAAQYERYNFIAVFGEVRHFPENGNKKYLSCEISLLADDTATLGSRSQIVCRGPCARHGKEQQVVSCPPRRRRPGRLSLRSVRLSVERQDLAGAGIAPPTPSPSGTPGSRQSAAAKHAQPRVPEGAR